MVPGASPTGFPEGELRDLAEDGVHLPDHPGGRGGAPHVCGCGRPAAETATSEPAGGSGGGTGTQPSSPPPADRQQRPREGGGGSSVME